MKLLVPASMRAEIQPLVPTGDDGILISYLWPEKVSKAELDLYRLALNFHPAPLPEYRGFAPYTWGILNGATLWGCTAHVMVEEIDAGPILRESRWYINPTEVTAESLRDESHRMLRKLLLDVVDSYLPLPKWQQRQQALGGRYYSKLDFENARRYAGWDPEVARRAFHCPPWPGWEPL